MPPNTLLSWMPEAISVNIVDSVGGSRWYNKIVVKSRKIQRGWYKNRSEKMRGSLKEENSTASKTRQTKNLSMGNKLRDLLWELFLIKGNLDS